MIAQKSLASQEYFPAAPGQHPAPLYPSTKGILDTGPSQFAQKSTSNRNTNDGVIRLGLSRECAVDVFCARLSSVLSDAQ